MFVQRKCNALYRVNKAVCNRNTPDPYASYVRIPMDFLPIQPPLETSRKNIDLPSEPISVGNSISMGIYRVAQKKHGKGEGIFSAIPCSYIMPSGGKSFFQTCPDTRVMGRFMDLYGAI